MLLAQLELQVPQEQQELMEPREPQVRPVLMEQSAQRELLVLLERPVPMER